MYVCVCHAITDRDIGAAVSRGCGSLKDLRRQLGLGSCCGRCNGCANQMLRQIVESVTTPQPTAAACAVP
jgi:bacterioferritin-associated ferredoxin